MEGTSQSRTAEDPPSASSATEATRGETRHDVLEDTDDDDEGTEFGTLTATETLGLTSPTYRSAPVSLFSLFLVITINVICCLEVAETPI